MKKIIAIITCFSALLLFSNTALSQAATTNEPTIDTKGAEKFKKQPEIKTAPDNKIIPERKIQQETVNSQQVQKTTAEEPVKGIKIDPSPALVAKDRPEISTLDPNKQPPPRVKSKEPAKQKID